MKIINYFLKIALCLFIFSINAETVSYYMNDVLGSPVEVFDQEQKTVWSEDYRPYGSKIKNPAINKSDVGYTGHQSDDNTGLTYMQARYYDADIGRFYSIDPVDFRIKNLQSFNRYSYANNNPYKYIDPDGKVPLLIPFIWFAAKEVAGEVFEHYTGVPAPTLKNAGKFVIKKSVKSVSEGIVQQSTKSIPKSKPNQLHHFATDKNKIFSPRMQKIADKYNLKLDETWNKELLPHQGRHPNLYHEFVERGMEKAAKEAGDNVKKFQELFNKYVKEPVRLNPELLTKAGWEPR